MPTRRRYSSVEGCCICGTNSSTGPFVTSEKVSHNEKSLDDIFKNCFELNEERKGEWCISCKDIAKKWLKTSKTRRSSTSFKKLIADNNTEAEFVFEFNEAEIVFKVVDSKRRHKPRRLSRSTRLDSREEKIETENGQDSKAAAKQETDMEIKNEKDVAIPVIQDALSEDENEDEVQDIADLDQSPPAAFDSPFDDAALPDGYPINDKHTATIGTQTTFLFPTLTSPQANANKLPFIDLSKWRQEEICCGTIFRGPNGEVLVDPKWLRPSCSMCNRSTQLPTPVETGKSEEISVFDEKLSSLCS